MRRRCAHASSAGRSRRYAWRPPAAGNDDRRRARHEQGRGSCCGRPLRRRCRVPLPSPATTSRPIGFGAPFPQTRQTKPVARQQHDKRRPNSNPPNEFSLLSPKTHQATPGDTRQRVPQVGVFAYLGGAAAGGSPQGSQPKSPCRPAITRQATSQLQPAQQLRPTVAQNASGDTKRHATASRAMDSTSCRPVASPKTRRRHPNPLPRQSLRFLSPETHEATRLPARKFAREATTAVIAPLLQWAACRQFGHLFSPFKDYR